MLFQDRNFDVAQVVKYFRQKVSMTQSPWYCCAASSQHLSSISIIFEQNGELAIYYEMNEEEKTETRGIVEVCPKTSRYEKSLS